MKSQLKSSIEPIITAELNQFEDAEEDTEMDLNNNLKNKATLKEQESSQVPNDDDDFDDDDDDYDDDDDDLSDYEEGGSHRGPNSQVSEHIRIPHAV